MYVSTPRIPHTPQQQITGLMLQTEQLADGVSSICIHPEFPPHFPKTHLTALETSHLRDQAAFPWQQHDQVFALRVLRSQSWHMRRRPFHTHKHTHTHTPDPRVSAAKTKCPLWLAADWSCLTGASVRVSVLTWDWLYQNAKERSFIFNSSRGLPGSAGWLWDDLIPALWWAEVVLRSSDFW